MARYVYDSDLVNSAIDELNSSTTLLNDVNSEITNGINLIYTAQGADFIKIDTKSLMRFAPESQKVINDLIISIQNKAQQIEEYNNSSWFTKSAATIGMAVTKIFEGIGVAGEQVIDGVASLTGLVVGVFSEDTKNSIGEYIEKDHVGNAFAKSYESGFLSGIEKYSAMSSTSTAASVFKGIGVAAGYVGVAIAGGAVVGAIGGAGAAAGAGSAVASIATNASIAGVAGLGAGTERGLQKGKSYNDAFVQGAKQGAIQAGTTVVVGTVANKISKFFSKPVTPNQNTQLALTSGSNGAPRLTSGTGLVGYSDDVLQQLGKSGVVADSSSIFKIKNSATWGLADGSVVANPYFGMTDDAIVNVLKNNGVGVSDDVLNSINNATKAGAKVGDATSKAANAADDFYKAKNFVNNGNGGISNATLKDKILYKSEILGKNVSEKFAPVTNVAKATVGAVGKVGKSVGNVVGPILKETGQSIANSPAAKAMIASNIAMATGYQVASNLNDKSANLYSPSTNLQQITPNNSGVVFNSDGTIATVDDVNSNNVNNDGSSSVDSGGINNSSGSGVPAGSNGTNQNVPGSNSNISSASGVPAGSNGTNQNVIGSNSNVSSGSGVPIGTNGTNQNVIGTNVSENKANGVVTEIENSNNGVSNDSSEESGISKIDDSTGLIDDKHNDSNSVIDSYNDNSVSDSYNDKSISNITNNYDNRTINNITNPSSDNNNYASNSSGNVNSTASSSSGVSSVANQSITPSQTTSNQSGTMSYTTSAVSTQSIPTSSNVSTTMPVSANKGVMSNTTSYDSISSNVATTDRETGVINVSDYNNETTIPDISSEAITNSVIPDVVIPPESTISDVPITSKSNSSVIPTVLGVGAALAAGGVGVGTYIKHKKNNESDDESDSEYGFSSGEWPEETSQSSSNVNDTDSIEKESNNNV